MRAEAGASRALDAWLEELMQRWQSLRPGVPVRTHFDGTRPAPRIVAEQTLAQAIVNILNNAADASPAAVEVSGHWTEEELVLEIADRGSGLAPEIMNRRRAVPEHERGRPGARPVSGHTTFNRFGGAVRLLARAGGGTLCRLTLPLGCFAGFIAMPTEDRPTLLLVDDDTTFCQVLRAAFEARGFAVRVAHDVTQGIAVAIADPPEYAVVDLKMPGPSGLELVMKLKEIDANTRVVMLTGYASIATAVEAIKLGAVHYLAKPADADEIVAALHRDNGDPTCRCSRSRCRSRGSNGSTSRRC